MELNLNEIKNITLGAVSVEKDGGFFRFYRMNKAERDIYLNTKLETTPYATSGVKLRFKTNSEILNIKGEMFKASPSKAYRLEVDVNGEKTVVSENVTENGHPKKPDGTICVNSPFPWGEYEFGKFEFKLNLPKGENEITVIFPWSLDMRISEMVLSDNAYVTPVKPDKKILMYGDSITCGHDAILPSQSYAELFCEKMHAEIYNKGIGSDFFRKELAEIKQDFTPDLITVAYGVNDWAEDTREFFAENCKGFFVNLRKNYPDTKIVFITPVHNGEEDNETKLGKLSEVYKFAETLKKEIPNLTVINGFNLVPKDWSLFCFDKTHPNIKGFKIYAENLCKIL